MNFSDKLDILYARRSSEDGKDGESIENQVALLKQYATDKGYYNIKVVTDDGYTGTNFNRPGFQEAFALIQHRRVGRFIVKDLSRLGRNTIEVGQYIGVIFPRFGVEFISVHDGPESSDPDSLVTQFKNIMNEYYAKDISDKQKLSLQARSNSGRHIASTPTYGYKLDPNDRYQYYIEESHPAIIVPEEFELVQAELLRRQNLRRQYNGKSIFAARLVCGDCGNFFGAKVWHSNSKYRQVIWQCNHKFQGVCKCQTPHLQESVIQQRFQAAVQELLQKRKAILENCQVMLELLTDCTDLEYQLQELETQKMRISEQVQGYVRENSEIVQDQEKYEERYQALVGQYEPLQKQETTLQEQRAERLARREQIQGFQRALNGQNGMLPEFDTQLWLAAVEKAVVHRDGKIMFVLKDGTELVQKI